MQEIVLLNGGVALVDDADFDWLRETGWFRNGDGYAYTSGREGKRSCVHLMHRLIMLPPADMEVHHDDRNRLNNQRHNLKIVTVAEHRLLHAHRPGRRRHVRIYVPEVPFDWARIDREYAKREAELIRKQQV